MFLAQMSLFLHQIANMSSPCKELQNYPEHGHDTYWHDGETSKPGELLLRKWNKMDIYLP